MGAYMSSPKTEKVTDSGENDAVQYGVSAMQGWRNEMEDAHVAKLDFDGNQSNFFAVFDGHGGCEVAKYCALNMSEELSKLEEYTQGNVGAALQRVFMLMDSQLADESKKQILQELANSNHHDGEACDGGAASAAVVLSGAHRLYGIDSSSPPDQAMVQGEDGHAAIASFDKASSNNPEADVKKVDDQVNCKSGDGIENGGNTSNADGGSVASRSSTGMEDMYLKAITKQQEPGASDIQPGSDQQHDTRYGILPSAPFGQWPNSGRRPVFGRECQDQEGNRKRVVSDRPVQADGQGSNSNGVAGDVAAYASSSSSGESGSSDSQSDCIVHHARPNALETWDSAVHQSLDNDAQSTLHKRRRIHDMEVQVDGQVSCLVDDVYDGVHDSPYIGPQAGCTAIAAVLKSGKLFVANAGDSRAVVSLGGEAIALSRDHKPDDEPEYSRIVNAGGYIQDGRVNGNLNLSRAIGDLEYKQNKNISAKEQMVTAYPELVELDIQNGEFIILACDGIWDVMTNQEAVDFVREKIMQGMPLKHVCEAMCDHCLAPDTRGMGRGCDNMSIMVVQLKQWTPGVTKNKDNTSDMGIDSNKAQTNNNSHGSEQDAGPQPNQESNVQGTNENSQQNVDKVE